MIHKNSGSNITLFGWKAAMDWDKTGSRADELIDAHNSTGICALPNLLLFLNPFVTGLTLTSLAIGVSRTGGGINRR